MDRLVEARTMRNRVQDLRPRRPSAPARLVGIAAVALVPLVGCDNGQTNLLGGVPAIAYISRTPVDTGNVFDYAANGKDGNLFTLTPPDATGVKKNLTNWTGGDVNALDLSFDAREIAFSGRAPGDDHYHIFRVNVDGTNPCDAALGKVSQGPCQITMGPNDEVEPLFIPGERIVFVTNHNVEGAAVPQFRDEYERGVTGQFGSCNLDGSGIVWGPRNVSHRLHPSLLSDGRILFTEWRHMGDVNEGDFSIMNQDLTGVKEGFGRENKAITNSHLRGREVSPGIIAAIGTARDRTYQSGKLLLINLGGLDISQQSEARSSVTDLTPLVPPGGEPSFNGVGRYYDIMPIHDPNNKKFLVSWSDGFVETAILSMAHSAPDFGIYVFDAATQNRYPVVNGVGTWETSPTPIVPRAVPPQALSLYASDSTQSTLISTINVYDSTMFPDLVPGSVKKVRVTEGFSTEEGFLDMFGLTDFDGQARLGEVDVAGDGSFKALVPANVPIRLQLIDKYGLAVHTPNSPSGRPTASEPVWIQGKANEARACPGCHNDRTHTIALAPGSSLLQATSAAPFDYPGLTRPQRMSTVFTKDKVMGVPWTTALQPIFDAHCTDCHNGMPGLANPSYTIMDTTDMSTFSFTFDLTSKPVTITAGMRVYTYSSSHIALLGPAMIFREAQTVYTMGMPKAYVTPGSAYDSDVIKMLNPPAQYPAFDPNDRAFGAAPQHPAEVGTYNGFNGADAKYQLTADEYFLLGLSFDNGAQYYSRENNPGAMP
jgi:hypothetical protein